MKTICAVLLAVVFSIELHAQSNKNCNSSLYRSEISLGLGIVYDSYDEKILPFSGLNINIHTYKLVFVDIGTQFNISGRDDKSIFRFAIYACPNLQFVLLKNKMRFFTGAGLYLNKPFTNFRDNTGMLFFLRGEYNINKKFSAGLDFKTAVFGKSDNDETVKFTFGSIYIAYRL